MIVFLLFSVPLWFIFLNTFFHNEGMRKRDFLIPLGFGAVLYIVALLLSWMIADRIIVGAVTPVRLFLYNLKFYNGLIVCLWLVLYFLSRLPANGRNEGYRFREILLLLSALFFGDSLYRTVISESWYGLYEFFYLPLGNLGQIVILAVLLVRMDSYSLPGKALLMLLSVLVVFLYNLIPTFFSYNLVIPAAIGGIILFPLAFFLFREELKGGLPASMIRYRKD